MSLYGLLTTGASGMAAQSALLGSVANNIANVNTAGYKDASTAFASMVLSGGASGYQSGSVISSTTTAVSAQGGITTTTSPTDLAIQGAGFFPVQLTDGKTTVLTRAGNFTQTTVTDPATGQPSTYLVNSAGYKLEGFAIGASGANTPSPINVPQTTGKPVASTAGVLSVNLPSNATAVAAASLPSANWATATSFPNSNKTSIVTYDNLGNQVNLDVYSTLTTTANTWQVNIFNAADASGGLPYAHGPLTTQTLTFNSTTGAYVSGSPVSVAIPGGATMSLDMSSSTQFAANYTVSASSANGHGASQLSSIGISSDGTLSALYQDGTTSPLYTIQLANVPSPDNMAEISGNAFMSTKATGSSLGSGDIQYAVAGTNGLGLIQSNALESSTVDLSTELTNMITAQNNYQANSKVFQTGSTLLEVLVNLVK